MGIGVVEWRQVEIGDNKQEEFEVKKEDIENQDSQREGKRQRTKDRERRHR